MSFTVKERRRVAISFEDDEGLTEQSHKESCDIHVIMKKAAKTGLVEHVNQYQGTYGEFGHGPDFHQAMNLIANAEQMFETIPAEIRKKFGNDPGVFLDWINNDKNYDEVAELGFDNSHLTKIEEPAAVADSKPE